MRETQHTPSKETQSLDGGSKGLDLLFSLLDFVTTTRSVALVTEMTERS